MSEVLYFSAEWCQPCRVVGKSVAKIDAQFPDITFRKVDVDDEAELAREHGVRSIPTLVHLKDGHEIARVVGSKTKDDIVAELLLPSSTG